MSKLQRLLLEFSDSSAKLDEANKALDQARAAFSENPDDEMARSRFTKLSTPAGYPDVHAAAVAFQTALHSSVINNHSSGWQGAEDELEQLRQTADTHGLDPGLFVTQEGAGSKREHILQLARLYGGKFLPGDGRSGIWDPQAHSFPDGDSAQQFADTVDHFYPALGASPIESQTGIGDGTQGDQPAQSSWSVNFTHKQLGAPYPTGTSDHANHIAKKRSNSAPQQHHVVVDQQTGHHSVSLDPDLTTHQVVQTYQSGQPIGPQLAGPAPVDDTGVEDGAVEWLQNDRKFQMSDELAEIWSLYHNSVRRSPSLMMEAIPVDANRDATERGNSHFDRFASPATREMVLKARLDEIEAFAKSRSIPVSNVYAIAEASMRTGKIPDLGQYGLAGDDAVATKQFVISNILNIQGLESVTDDGQVIDEAGTEKLRRTGELVQVANSNRERAVTPRAGYKQLSSTVRNYAGHDPEERKNAKQELDSIARTNVRKKITKNVDESHGLSKLAAGFGPYTSEPAAKYMKRRPQNLPKLEDSLNEEGGPYKTGGAPEGASLSPTRMSPGSDAPVDGRHFMKQDLLPKKLMDEIKKKIGNAVYGYSKTDLLKLARELGLLGTEEGKQNDPKKDNVTEIPVESWARLDPEMARLLGAKHNIKSLAGASLSEHDYKSMAEQHGGKYVGYAQPHQAIYEFPNHEAAQKFANYCADKTKSTPHVSDARVSVDEPRVVEAGHLGYAGTSSPMRPGSPHNMVGPDKVPFSKEEKKEPKTKSESEKILGIEPDDPRAESWPKIGTEMKKLLNLEQNRFFAPKPGIRQQPDMVVQEATFGGQSVGAFLGAGMGGDLGLRLMQRMPQIPPYDKSIDLPDDREEKIRRMRELLRQVGLRAED